MQKKLKELHGHIILCGYGIVGQKAYEVLKENQKEVVVIEQKPDKAPILEANKAYYIIGDATSQEVLIEAGIERAKAIIIAIDNDAVNLFITVLAKQLNKNIIIASRVNSEETLDKIKLAGASITVTPERSAAKELTREIAKRYFRPFWK